VATTSTAVVEHPIALVVAVVLAAPIIWQIAVAWFSNIEEDAKEAAPYEFLNAIGGLHFITWLPLKIFWFLIASSAIVITFYKVGSWLAEW
jgi:hypothetical protein